MKVYYGKNIETGEEYFTTSGNDLAGFVKCNANHLRETIAKGKNRIKGFYVASGEVNKIRGRGGFMRDNTQF